MGTALLEKPELKIPVEHERHLAEEASRQLALRLNQDADVRLQMLDGEQSGSIVTIPASVLRLLQRILTEMAEGNAVTVMPIHAELTTQQTADFLNVSRPFVVRLLEEGAIPHRKVGTHRRVLFADALAYNKASKVTQKEALRDFAEQAQESGMGY